MYLPLIFARRLIISLFGLCICVPYNFLVSYAVRVVSEESRRLVLPGDSSVYYEITLMLMFVCPPHF
jgi:hypothetical protein